MYTVNVEIFAFFASETISGGDAISRVGCNFARGDAISRVGMQFRARKPRDSGQRPRKFSRGVYFHGKDLNRENSENFHVYSTYVGLLNYMTFSISL